MRERVDFYQQGLLDDDSPARVQDLLTGYTSRIPFVGGLLSDVIDPREVQAADLDREAAYAAQDRLNKIKLIETENKDYFGNLIRYLPIRVIPERREKSIEVLPEGEVNLYSELNSANNRELMDWYRSKIKTELEPQYDYFFRFTNNRQEPEMARNRTLRPSKNFADNIYEKGLSVADAPHYGIRGYKHGYTLTGDVIGEGSDGEPILDLATLFPLTKRVQSPEKLIKKDKEKLAAKLKELGWTPDQYLAAMTRLQFMTPEEYEKHNR